jgi:DNA-binding NarL/FixJ family response regulator
MKVAIVEDDFVIAELLEKKIEGLKGFTCSGKFPGPVSFLRSEVKPDIVLLDISMPEMNGIDAIPLILKIMPKVSIIINTINDDVNLTFKALQLGATGYIDKQTTDIELSEVLNSVVNGGAYMTPSVARKIVLYFNGLKNNLNILSARERDVADCILEGLSYKQVGDRLFISIDTVRMHVKQIYKKLSIKSKAELFVLFK